MASTFSQHFRIFHKLEKNVFSKNYFFSQKIMHVTSIFFNWYLFRNTNLIYHDEMPKKKNVFSIRNNFWGYFSIFCFIFLAIFGACSYLASKKIYFYVFIMDSASKSLKHTINIVLLSRFMSKGLTKLNFALLYGSNMSYFM